jgi:hypothetical protein
MHVQIHTYASKYSYTQRAMLAVCPNVYVFMKHAYMHTYTFIHTARTAVLIVHMYMYSYMHAYTSIHTARTAERRSPRICTHEACIHAYMHTYTFIYTARTSVLLVKMYMYS